MRPYAWRSRAQSAMSKSRRGSPARLYASRYRAMAPAQSSLSKSVVAAWYASCARPCRASESGRGAAAGAPALSCADAAEGDATATARTQATIRDLMGGSHSLQAPEGALGDRDRTLGLGVRRLRSGVEQPVLHLAGANGSRARWNRVWRRHGEMLGAARISRRDVQSGAARTFALCRGGRRSFRLGAYDRRRSRLGVWLRRRKRLARRPLPIEWSAKRDENAAERRSPDQRDDRGRDRRTRPKAARLRGPG